MKNRYAPTTVPPIAGGTTSKIVALSGPLYHVRKKNAAQNTGMNTSMSRIVSSQIASGAPMRNPTPATSGRAAGNRFRSASAIAPPASVPAIPKISPYFPSRSVTAPTDRLSSRDMKLGAHPMMPFIPNEMSAPPTNT